MMKNNHTALAAAALSVALLAGCGSDSAAPASVPTPEPTAVVTPEPTPTPEVYVDVTIPASILGEITAEQVESSVSSNGYASGKLNSDGSVTYSMTESQQKEIMETVAAQVESGINDLLQSGDYPNINGIEHSDDFTTFTVTLNTSELGLMDSMIVLSLYSFGGMYNAIAQTQVDNIRVTFIDESGAVIDEANSKNLG